MYIQAIISEISLSSIEYIRSDVMPLEIWLYSIEINLSLIQLHLSLQCLVRGHLCSLFFVVPFYMPLFTRPSFGCHRTSLFAISSSCLMQWPAILILLCLIFIDIFGRFPYSSLFIKWSLHETF